MTDEEINIAIAKACEWELTPNAWWYKEGEYLPFEPDYCNDLNAMHEAEKVLSERDHFLYASILAKLCGDVVHNNRTWYHLSTAAQRAEAFLRTLNLWQE